MSKIISGCIIFFILFVPNSYPQNNSCVLLYSQTGLESYYTSLPSYKNTNSIWEQVADDFTAASNWAIDQIVVVADYIDTSSVDGFNVYIYLNNNGTSGTLIYSAENQPYTFSIYDYFSVYNTITLETPAKLIAGNYFISVQFNNNSGNLGWYWTQVNGSFGEIAMFRNYSTYCSSWAPLYHCLPTGFTDMYFELWGTTDAPTNIEEQLTSPSTFSLEQNYPNPFNPSTNIKYSIPQSSNVVLKIYDVLGNKVTTLINEEKPAGNYEVDFDASNLSSGTYFYQLRAGAYIETKKMILMK